MSLIILFIVLLHARARFEGATSAMSSHYAAALPPANMLSAPAGLYTFYMSPLFNPYSERTSIPITGSFIRR